MKTYIYIDDSDNCFTLDADDWKSALINILKFTTLPQNAPENSQCRCLRNCDSSADAIELFEMFKRTVVLYLGEITPDTCFVNRMGKFEL